MANFYWVGGTNTWTATNFATVWRTGGDGTGGSGLPATLAPGVNDTVSFTLPGPYTVTLNIAVNVVGFFDSHTSGTVTFAGTGSVGLSSGAMSIGNNGPSVCTASWSVFLNNSAQPGGIGVLVGANCPGGIPNVNITCNSSGTGFAWIYPTTCGSITASSGPVKFQAGSTVNARQFAVSTSYASTIDLNGATVNLTGTGLVLYGPTLTNATITDSLGGGNFTATMNTAKTFTWGTTGGSSTKAVNLYLTSGVSIPTFTTNSWFKTISLGTGVTGTPTAATVNVNSLGLNSTINHSNISWIFRGTGVLATTNNTNWSGNTVINAPGGNLVLQDAWNHQNGIITVTAGTLTTSSFAITCTNFSSSNANTRTLALGASTITITDTGTVWNATTATGLTVTGTPTINFSSASTKTFAGGGAQYYNIQNSGAGALTITGSNSFNNISALAGSTITLTAGTTQTFRFFTLKGSAGSLITLNSSTAGSQAFVARNSNTNMISTDYLSITDIATIGGTWYAGTNSTSVSNNTGWSFTLPPDPTGNLLAMFVP